MALAHDAIKPPEAVDALELVFATILELKTRATDQIFDRLRDEHLGGACRSTHPAPGMKRRSEPPSPTHLVRDGALTVPCVLRLRALHAES
jgi:hypothetical protein